MAKKRSDGSGSVKKLPSGNWRGQIMDGYQDNGKKKVISFTCKTKGEVLDKIRAYWNEKDNPKPPEEVKTPFSEWADTWYADYCTEVQPSTYANYQYTLARLKSQFGDKPLTEIKAMDINRFYDLLKTESRSASYMTKCKSMLIQIFDAAEANELVARNPARMSKSVKTKSDPFNPEVVHREKDAFTDQEQELLRELLPDSVAGHSILLMLGTGMRTQELLALMPADIAKDGSAITINKAIKMVDGVPTLGPPKSSRGNRVIPVPTDYREHALFVRKHSGKPYIWTSKRPNGLFDVGVFRKQYYRALKKIPGIRPLSPHCCRHTYISNLEKKGVPMEQIARLAGHSRITTTDGYLHTDMATLSNAVAVLNENKT
jgi:integrase